MEPIAFQSSLYKQKLFEFNQSTQIYRLFLKYAYIQ